MWRLNNEDRGASMVFIAICLVFLIGFAGLAVDVGALYAERTELQKGAEAAVLAIAEDCGHGTKPCDVPTASATAEDYIDANATDLVGALDSLNLDTVGQTVTAIDKTERSDGGSIFLPFFAQVIGWEGMTVKAQASAAWGAPSAMATAPIIISECEYLAYVDEYGAPIVWPRYPEDFYTDATPPTRTWPASPPRVFTFHSGNSTSECNAQAGQDADLDGKLPGGFGWLDTGGDDCVAETSDEGWFDSDPGASPSNGCEPDYMELLVNTVIPLPWFKDSIDNGVQGAGAHGEFLLEDYSAFYVTGFNFAGQYKEESLYSGQLPCKGDDRCIEGYFVSGVTLTDADDLGGDYRGILVVKLTG